MKTHTISNKEFLEKELAMNVGFHGMGYIALMRGALETTLAITGPVDTFVDLGAGTGVLAALASEKVEIVRALDTNPEHKKYYKANAASAIPSAEKVDFCDCDFTKKRFNFKGRTLLACIEVAEHIHDGDYERFLKNAEDRADWFLFSSTPKKGTPGQDATWGHVNVKPTNEWIELHERFGWKLHKRLSAPTRWSLLFKNAKS